ncbi:MAG: DUF6161 domain-containing protein [bacterium]|nr:DUF6161 domain-containing protein [bacterium]
MNSQIEPFLAIHRLQRPLIVLSTEDDAAAFLNEEEKIWAWTNQPTESSSNIINNVASRYRPDDWILRFRHALDQNKDDFRALMRERYGRDQMLCGIDPESHALRVLSETDRIVAAVTLATVHAEVPVNDPNFLRSDIRHRIGVARGNALLAGIDQTVVDGINRDLLESRAAIDVEAQRMRDLINSQQRVGVQSTEEIRDSAHALGVAHEAAFTQAEADRVEKYHKLQSDLEATHRAYEVQMQLQAPVLYWRTRAAQYRKAAGWSLAVLILFSAASVSGLFWLYERAAAHLPTDSTTVPYAALFRASAFALLMTSILFWAGRVILRIYLSARHLATDAEERRTMITTFLALTKKASVGEEDRKFILAALFRPSADGIVKEESAPDTMFAALMGSVLKK